MTDWDKWRKEADSFEIENELSRFDESSVRTYRESIKDIRKTIRLSQLMSPSVNSLNKRMFTPKESARQRGMFDGMNAAFTESIKMFKDADRFAWDQYETLQTLAKKIQLRRKEMKLARERYDETDNKKIYNEMYVTCEICFLIGVWRKYLNQDDNSFTN